MPRGKEEIVELSAKFRGEQLLIESERAALQQLNTDVESLRARLFQQAWVCRRQNRFLGRLVVADCGSRLENACQEAKVIEGIVAREGHKLLGSHECWVADLLRKLMNSPQLVAHLLCQSQNFEGCVLQDLSHITYNSIYGACLFPFDEKLMLSVLLELVKLEFTADSNPRRMLRKGSCAFGRLYRLFSEGHYASRMFLTAALHEPIMNVLSGDELFLDIDPKKNAIRFPPAERVRRFGEEGTKEYQENIDKYRAIVVGKLQLITKKFITSLRESMQWFPPCLVWLIRNLYDHLLSKTTSSAACNPEETEAAKEEAYKICTDLILTYFICPAVANPEPLGIIGDVPVSYIARFNLMQIGQIFQTLAVLKYERYDPSQNDLYSNLDQNSVSSLVSGLLGIQLVGLDDMYPSFVAPELPSLDLSSLLIRNVSLITLTEVNELLSYLRSVEGIMLRRIPQEFEEVKFLLNKLPTNFSAPTLHLSSAQVKSVSPSGTVSSGKKRTVGPGKLPSGRKSDSFVDSSINNNDAAVERNTELLVIPIGPQSEPVGFQSEEKVLQSLEQDMSNLNVPHDGFHGKRTRFSLSRDQESTGTSENLEAEGSSNHSGCSSGEEDIGAADGEISLMNDNLSDVMPTSANVSTPSVSGRDTPLSSHPEEIAGDEGADERPAASPLGAAAQRDESRSNGLPVAPEKESRSDIQEKFGKFEIPPPNRERHRNFLGDETHSLVSDSWSTDVLASDSEYQYREDANASALPDVVPGQPPDIPRLDLIAEESANVVGATGGGSDAGGDDRSDTWSVDVLASDTEETAAVGGPVDVEDISLELSRAEASGYGAGLPGLDVMDFPDPPYSFHRDPDDLELNSTAATRGSVTPPYSSVTPGDRTPPETRGLEVSFSAAQSSVGSDKLRRQSSGSSFQSKSDVEWEREDVTLGTEAAVQRSEGIPPLGVEDAVLPNTATLKPLTVQLRDLSGTIHSPTAGKFHTEDAEKTPVAVFSSVDPDPEGSPLSRQSLGRLSFGLFGASDSLLAPTKVKATSDQGDTTGLDCTDVPQQQPTNVKAASGQSKSVGGTPDSLTEKMRAGGAIPKVFPASAFVNGHGKRLPGGPPKFRAHEDMKNAGKNFLKGLKGLATTGKGKVTRSRTDDQISSFNSRHAEQKSEFKMPYSASTDEIVDHANDSAFQKDETSDEILEKYRQAVVVPPAQFSVGDLLANNADNTKDPGNQRGLGSPPTIGIDMVVNPIEGGRGENSRPFLEGAELLHSQSFLDTKRKLRLVLSSVDVQTLPNMSVFDASTFAGVPSGLRNSKSLELLNLLKILLAEAINGQDKTKTAQIRETVRCISGFDQKSLRKLMKALRDDYKKRGAYLTYLSQSKLNLLRAKSFFERLIHRVDREQQLVDDCLVEVVARIYLEKRERDLQRFLADFQRLELQDEKTDLVDVFLKSLYDDMQEVDETWRSASESQITRAQLCIERSVMSQIYIAALYPNGDGDVSRDQVLHDHIKRLAEIITPGHKYCNIPAVYHGESPWPSAQSELSMINAYKTPRDKLFCVARTCEIIMNLLKLSAGNSGAPAADDFTPVLIFVLVKANPPSLLSTIEYVDAFYGKRISGEYSYWWMQFCAAVKFIKTCDYSS